MKSTARVPTEKPNAYLAQLCRHFSHKGRSEWNVERGWIELQSGRCDLASEPGTLVLTVSADDEERLTRCEDVYGGHLERFGRRDELAVSWTRD